MEAGTGFLAGARPLTTEKPAITQTEPPDKMSMAEAERMAEAQFGIGDLLTRGVGELAERGARAVGLEKLPGGKEATRLVGAGAQGAATPFPGVGTAARAGWNVAATASSDVAGLITDNPIAKFAAGVIGPLFGHGLLRRAILTEPFERAQGAKPKIGPEATAAAREAEGAGRAAEGAGVEDKAAPAPSGLVVKAPESTPTEIPSEVKQGAAPTPETVTLYRGALESPGTPVRMPEGQALVDEIEALDPSGEFRKQGGLSEIMKQIREHAERRGLWFANNPETARQFSRGGKTYFIQVPKADAESYRFGGGESYVLPRQVASRATEFTAGAASPAEAVPAPAVSEAAKASPATLYLSEAKDALKNLGYKSREADSMLNTAMESGTFESSEDLVRAALRGGRKPAEAPKPTPAEADEMVALQAHPEGAITYMKVGDLRENPDLMKVDAERFQFKQNTDKKGVGKELGDIEKWNSGLGGVMTAYHTPEGDFVINGHHRMAAALEKAKDSDTLRFQWLDAGGDVPGAIKHNVTPAEARAYGALVNMGEQRGTALDYAQFMRDSGMGPEHIRSLGISMSEAKTSDAEGLAKLSPFLWQQIKSGNLKESIGVEIGRGLPESPELQNDLYKEIASDKKLTPSKVADLIRLGGRTIDDPQAGLFGPGFLKKTTLRPQVDILDHVRDDMADNARSMQRAAEGKETLEGVGETAIDAPELQARAAQARQLAGYLPRFVYDEQSETNRVLKQLGYELAEDPKKRNAIYERARVEMPKALQTDAERVGLALRPEPVQEQQAGLFGASEGTAARTGGGSTELGAGIPFHKLPQAWRTVAALGRGLGRKLSNSQIADSLKKIAAPETRGPFARTTAEIISERDAEMRALLGSMRAQVKDYHGWFKGLDKNARWETYAQIEAGNLEALPENMRGYAGGFNEVFEKMWNRMLDIRQRQRGLPFDAETERPVIGYIRNYLPHLFAGAPEEVSERLRTIENQVGRPLVGTTKFLKQRRFPVITEAMRLGLQPKFENPVDMMLAGLENEARYVTGQEVFQELKDAGLAKFAKYGDEPKGWAPIDDRIANVRQWSPTEKGWIERGHYVMPEQAARILNNYTGPGIPTGKIGRAYRNIGALGNVARVFGGFHVLLETRSLAQMEAGAAAWESMGKLVDGDMQGAWAAAKRLPKAALYAPKAYEAWREGRQLQNKVAARELEDPAVRDVIRGGGNFDFGDGVLAETLTNVLGEKLGRSRNVLNEVVGAVMKRFVGPVKLGAHRLMYDERVRQATVENGGEPLNEIQRRRISFDVRRHLDDTLGQVARANLHFSNKMKDTLGMILAFPGWQIGNIRLFGGALRGMGQAATGAKLDANAKLALQYVTGKALLSGIEGTLINYYVTGEFPKSVYEVYTWPTGEKDSNGNWIRLAPPELMTRDLLSAVGKYKRNAAADGPIFGLSHSTWETVLSKLNWPIVAGLELYNNADFSGKPITFPRAEGTPKTVARMLGHIASQGYEPFGVRNVFEQQHEAGLRLPTVKEVATGALGLTPTSRALRQTPMQNYVDAIEHDAFKKTATSPQAVELQNAKRELRHSFRDMRAGKTKALPDAKEYLKRGLAPQDIAHEWKQSRLPPLEAAMHRIPLTDVAKAFQVAEDHGDDKDATLAKRVLMQRIQSGGWQRLNPQQRNELAPLLRNILTPKKKHEETGAVAPAA